ncbi:MAG: hypothetical protein U0W24_18835 [Bacteroidales bacterium]
MKYTKANNMKGILLQMHSVGSREKYQIEKVICVADTGMMNQDNILEVGQNGYEFIFGERLKNLEQGIQNEILNREYYQILTMDDVDSNDKIEISITLPGTKIES